MGTYYDRSKRAEDERKRADDERNLAEDEQRKRAAVGEMTRSTTFEEYLRACHTCISLPLRIQTDKSLTTQGSVTSPKDRVCPTLLKPWTDFPSTQQSLFDEISSYIPPDLQHFSSRQYIQELGRELCDRPLASEKDLEGYLRLAVERPTTNIISALQIHEDPPLDGGISFENHMNTLADGNEEVEDSLKDLRISSGQLTPKSRSRPTNTDQNCVYIESNGTRSLRMIVEYKPAHKVTSFNLRADPGSMHLPKDVFNRITIPNDKDAKFIYHSEWLVSAMLTQTYGYMIENGLEYSYVTTGEAYVTRSQIWRNETVESASRASVDYEAVLQETPMEVRLSSPPASVFSPKIRPFHQSAIVLRSRKTRLRNSCGTIDPHAADGGHDPSASSDEPSDIDTPSKPKVSTRRPQVQGAKANTPSKPSRDQVRHAQYCTQACLLGVIRRQPLDNACPNVSIHRAHSLDIYHGLRRKTLKQAMARQLQDTPDSGCEPLGKQGARGALFRLTLESHSYTFVAKGTVEAFKKNLKHEASVYRHLYQVQGALAPVYLGSVSLERPYFLDFGVRITHMLMMMSWVGNQATQNITKPLRPWEVDAVDDKTEAAAEELRQQVIEHRDLRPPNVLWSAELGRVMLIDFERSRFLKTVLAPKVRWPKIGFETVSIPEARCYSA
ncbi:hypothetical protein B7463_g10008, partial [Scytalidium lignicola]